MMKWLLLAAAFFVAIILMVIVIGMMLPRTHRVSRTIHLKHSPEAVFALIVVPQNWQAGISSLPAIGGRRRWQLASHRRSITLEEALSDPPHLDRWQMVGENLPFSGTWTWQVTPTQDGCTCQLTEDGEVSNPIFRFVGQVLIGYTKTVDEYLAGLEKALASAPRANPPTDVN